MIKEKSDTENWKIKNSDYRRFYGGPLYKK